ncbi:glycosyltransferase family 4 protein [Azospirillum griseum]|uniref:Glycosyltransferase family 4 protein n=1 Tax=Azospirillum griseum TaxID=2496639 RepID=A0A3S0I0D2_9PROT|nr:glycosyltransferase family 4 protein [Azospirillum griseum]
MSCLAVLATATVVAAALTGWIGAWLRRKAILDHPNERSSHSVPTPRGGGWGIMLTLLPGWALVALLGPGGAGFGVASFGVPSFGVWVILAGVAVLMAVSWIDDRRNLPPAPRFLSQIAVVLAGLAALPADGLVFQGLLPLWADRLVVAVGWLWFVNLFNFMDGIDGLAGSEAATIGGGVALVGALAGLNPAFGLYGLVAAGGALGFLVWNWHPARLFMGDVGSVPLGYALGWLLLSLAASGHWAAALLIPAYFLADATLTLLRRLVEGKKVWQAHREHFYQKATQRGRSHAQVVRLVLALNVALVALAALSLVLPMGWSLLLPGVGAVALLLATLARPVRGIA